jgi:signal transduction histidine kinase
LAAVQNMFKYQSGRVIALGRVMLAGLFLIAVWVDRSQPQSSAAGTYGLLGVYLAFAILFAAVTWRNWWLDARLALPAHAIDMAVFTTIIFSTNGYTSPFFLFFALPLLAAAIRWGWRETALTASVLVLLYLTAGLVVAGTQPFEVQRFVIRSGHLVILSALLIWFGMHQRLSRLFFRFDEIDSWGGGYDDPVELGLRFAMEATGARSGVLVSRSADTGAYSALRISDDGASRVHLDGPLLHDSAPDAAWLFDFRIGSALTRTAGGHARFIRTSKLFDTAQAERLHLAEGLIADISTGTSQCWLVLQEIPDLSSDYVELGRELANAVRAVTDHAALLTAIEQGAAARTRLTLAGDVHDGVVQFLAGATFRIEAIARAARSGANVEGELTELKGLLVDEQREIRGFVTALRRDHELALADAVAELRALAARLGQQWDVKCRVNVKGEEIAIPIKLQLDLQQLLRETVANAVRHGGASQVDVSLAVDGDQLQFNVRDNGRGFVLANGNALVEPWSLKERVERANGSLFLVSEQGRTNVSISLPIAGAAA